MVEKFGKKDAKKVHFIKQMEFRKKSNEAIQVKFSVLLKIYRQSSKGRSFG